MTFRETLDKHLQAIRERNLPALLETLPPEDIVLITSDGWLIRSVREFAEMHATWFDQTTWSLDARLVQIWETADLGVAVLRLEYRDEPPGKAPLHETSYLTLIFARRDDRWVMVQDQNTPCRKPAEGG